MQKVSQYEFFTSDDVSKMQCIWACVLLCTYLQLYVI